MKNTESDSEYGQKSDVSSKNMQILDNAFGFSLLQIFQIQKILFLRIKMCQKATKFIMTVYTRI